MDHGIVERLRWRSRLLGDLARTTIVSDLLSIAKRRIVVVVQPFIIPRHAPGSVPPEVRP